MILLHVNLDILPHRDYKIKWFSLKMSVGYLKRKFMEFFFAQSTLTQSKSRNYLQTRKNCYCEHVFVGR